jgi:hypothetical protein
MRATATIAQATMMRIQIALCFEVMADAPTRWADLSCPVDDRQAGGAGRGS